MLLHLVKKDLLIVKNFAIILTIIAIAIPILFQLSGLLSLGLFPFLYMVIIIEAALLQSISQVESKNPKAPSLLCATPYTRKALVQAKYVFAILIFVFCYIVYSIEIVLISPAPSLDLASVLFVLFCGVTVFSICIPVELKYGIVKTKFIFITAILLFSLGPTIFSSLFEGVDFSIFVASITAIPLAIKCIGLALMSVLVFMISMSISLRIFSKKEL